MEIRADPRDFYAVYESLPEGTIKDAVDQSIVSLKNNLVIGEHVRHEIIPKYYIKKHNIQSLYRVSLPQSWRLVYSIQSFYENETTVLPLELMNHKQYNKRFGYFKKKSA